MSAIIMFGAFPPPVHGMAAVNQAMLERLAAEGWAVEKLNTAPRTLERSLWARLSRIPMILRAWRQLVNKERPAEDKNVVYMALSGGWGKMYDLVTITICRMLHMSCVLHHHSFAYLEQKKQFTSWLIKMAGEDATHVVLCNRMRQYLKTQYGCKKVIVLSNVSLLNIDVHKQERQSLYTVGFLSNITREKGGWDVISLARSIKALGWPLRVVVAGPCYEQTLANELRKAQMEGALKWCGPVYAANKKQFWRKVDALVFPTTYVNEAEPLVVWEALAEGVPVIAYDRGCISNQVDEAGQMISSNKDFLTAALGIIGKWQKSPEFYCQYTRLAQQQYKEARKTAEQQWIQFVNVL